jgi:hypothetical protein
MLPQLPHIPLGRRARSLLAIVAAFALALLAAQPAHASVSTFLGSFDNGTFSAFNDGVNTTNAALTVVSNRSYGGTDSAFASYPGGGVNAYARVLEDVSWNAGDDVWYGAAYYLPVGFKAAMQQEVSLQRWDNWSTYGSTADQGGIAIWNSDKLARLKVGRYDASTETLLTNGFPVPEGRWFWLEVHQRFSATDGQALNEVYLDGALVGRSTTANFDRPIQKLRTGLVAQGGIAQTNPLSLWFDRVSIGSQELGPLGGSSATPPPAPAPAPAHTPPTVTITSPGAGMTFGNWLGMTASVSADTTVARVDFLVDGVVVASRTGLPWSYTYDSTGLSGGTHTVTIRATDADDLVGEASVQVRHYVNVRTHGNTRLAKAASATQIHMAVAVHHRHSGAKHHHKHHRRHAHATRRTHHKHHSHRHHRHHTA